MRSQRFRRVGAGLLVALSGDDPPKRAAVEVHLDLIRDLQRHRVLAQAHHGTVHAARRDHPVTLLDGAERRLPLPLLSLLGPNEQEIKDREDGREEEHLRHHGAGAAAVRRLGHRVSEVHHGRQSSGSGNCGRNRPRILPQNPMDRENKRVFSHLSEAVDHLIPDRGREAHHSHRAAATASVGGLAGGRHPSVVALGREEV